MALTKIDDRGLTTPIDLLDNEKIRFGTGNDLELYHDGTNSFIGNAGTLKVQSNYIYINDEDDNNHIRCEDGSYVSLHFNGIKKLETTNAGVKVLGAEASDANLEMYADEGDDAADKWNIYAAAAGHFGINNYASGSWEQSIECNPNGNVELYHNNGIRFETTSIGSKITGSLTINNSNYDGLIVKNNDDGSNGAYITLINDSASPSNADIAGIVNFRGKDSAGNDTTYGQVRVYTTDVTDGQESGEMTFNVRNANTFEEKIRITAAGSVGIGTATPRGSSTYQGLELNGTIGGVITFSDDEVEKWNLYGQAENFGIYDRVNTRYNLKCLDNGDVELPTGNLRVANGQGINFSDTSHVTGVESELLDDYESGTWTATVATGTCSQQSCNYVKVGSLVTIWGRIHGLSDTTTNIILKITGLPYTCSTSNAGGIKFSKDISTDANTAYITTAEDITFYGHNSANAWSYVTHLSCGSNTEIYFHASYTSDTN